ncbi:MAG: hypothetical protein ACYC4R_13775 [Anaerolineae bacterium]
MSERNGREAPNIVIGFVLLAFGVIFLLGQFLRVNFWGVAWPLFIIVPGLMFFVGMFLGGKSVSGLAIPGSIVTTVGLILLFQNTFNLWESWAYAWALIFPTAVGVGILIHGIWGGHPQAVIQGKNMAIVGLVVLVVAGTFFELVLNIGGRGSTGIVRFAWPALLVALGAYLLAKNLLTLGGPRRQDDQPSTATDDTQRRNEE